MKNNNYSLIPLIQRLWRHLETKRKRQFFFLLVLILTSSFAEVISIGAILPFLGILTSPEIVFNNSFLQPIVQNLKLNTPNELLFVLALSFSIAAIFAGITRLFLMWVTTKVSFATGADFSLNIYRRTLYQPYNIHCNRNSSEVLNGILIKSNGIIHSTIVPILTIISSFVILLTILISLLLLNPMVACSAFGGFGFIYIVIIYLTKKRLSLNSETIARNSTYVIKTLQEGLGGIRDVIIDDAQSIYSDKYRNADLPLRQAQANTLFINASPRYIVEALGMVIIAMLAFSIANKSINGVTDAIPILGALALGAQRLLPVLQQTFAAWSNIQSGRASLLDTLELLDQPFSIGINEAKIKSLAFNKNIEIKNLNFRHSANLPYIFKNLTLTIDKGSRIGLIGDTGVGKSTLIDIIMALLDPEDESLRVDGRLITPINKRAWQSRIAHVPQSIFLTDSSIEENIAFGVLKTDINFNKVKKAAQMAQIHETIEKLPHKYKTLIGERGIRLSGGQRQRIGIARALYKKADIIIFDEATSALDGKTELAVMKSIESLSTKITMIIIAHRFSTLKQCSQIVEIANSRIKRIGTYNYFLKTKRG